MLQIVHKNALLKTVYPSRSKTSSEGTSPGCLAEMILLNKWLCECYKFWLGMFHIVYMNVLLKTVSLSRNQTCGDNTSPNFPAEII